MRWMISSDINGQAVSLSPGSTSLFFKPSIWSWIAVGFMLIVPFLLSLTFLPVLPVMVTWIVFLAVLIPGDSFVQHYFPSLCTDPVDRIAAGSIAGYLLSTLAATAITIAFQPSLIMLMITITLSSILIPLLKSRSIHPKISLSTDQTTNVTNQRIFELMRLIAAVLILVMIAIPYSQVGEMTSKGIAYRDFFSGDFLKHAGITIGLTHSTIPPENPYFEGETLHYYWMYYLIPSMIMRQLGADTCEPILISLNMMFAGVFLWFWFGLCRRIITGKAIWLVSGFIPFAFYSWEGSAVLLDLLHKHKPWFRYTDYNIDGYSRWILGHPEIDGVYRLLLYNMQHIIPTILVLIALRLWSQPDSGTRRVSLGLGILAALSIGHSGFVGSFLVVWLGLTTLLTTAAGGKTVRERVIRACQIGIPPFLAMILYTFDFDMTGGGMPLTLTIVKAFRTDPLQFMTLNFGAGILALISIPYWRRISAPLSLLFTVSVFVLIGVIVPEWPSDVAVKVGYSTALSGALLTGLIPVYLKRKALRILFFVTFSIVGILSLPTPVFEMLNFYDIHNSNSSSYISTEEWDAYRWIRDQIPQEAIVQRGLKTDIRDAPFSPIPNFAQRRTAVGDRMHARIFLVPDEVYLPRRQDVEYIFRYKDAGAIHEICSRTGIDYIYWGVQERATFNEPEALMSRRDLFESVYATEHVTIFKVVKSSQ